MFRRALAYASLALALIFSPTCGNPAPNGPGTYIGNLHTHTTASDGVNSYSQMIAEAKAMDLDFIVITDHHTISDDAYQHCPTEKGILCILGEEICAREGHILAIGITEVIPPGYSAQETVDLIHKQGGIAIAAHLNNPDGYGISSKVLNSLTNLDAVEYAPIAGKDWYREVPMTETHPQVFDSDAHNLPMLHNVANSCVLEELSEEGVKAAIKGGKCEVYFP